MALEFHRVLRRIAARGPHEGNQSLIQKLALGMDFAVIQMIGFRLLQRQALDSHQGGAEGRGTFPADPDNANAPGGEGGGDGGDNIVVGHGVLPCFHTTFLFNIISGGRLITR